MDNDTKLVMFMETLGDGADVEVARSILEAMDWDLEAAIMTMTGTGPEPSAAPSTTARNLDADGYRAPMQTGYTDTLMAPINPAEQAAMERERQAAEAELKKKEDAERVIAEKRRREQVEEEVKLQRKQAEQEAHERRRKKREDEVANMRLQADPEALRLDQERRAAEAEAERQRQQVSEERRLRDEAKAEAEARARKQEADLQAKRREDKEKVDLLREKAEAEARQREASTAAAAPKEKPADELVQALGALRRKYKDSDPAGLVTCLATLRKYIDNLARNPSEPKFQRINVENNAFRTRVAGFDGAIAVLKACGFGECEGGQLAVAADFSKTKGSSLWDALAKVDVIINEAQAKVDALAKAGGNTMVE